MAIRHGPGVGYGGFLTSTGGASIAGRLVVRNNDGTVESEQIRIGRNGSDIRYHSIKAFHSTATNNYLALYMHDGGASPYTGQNLVLKILGTTLTVKVYGITQLGDGGTTNYSEFETDGTLEFNGTATVWNDANVGAMQLSLPVASQPDEDEFVDEVGADTGISTWAYAIGEYSSGGIEIPHDYKEGSDITFHVHFQIIGAPAGGTDNIKWKLTYTVAHGTDTLDAATTIVKEMAVTTQYGWYRADFPAITGTTFDIGDQFLFDLERVAASSDDYAGDPLVGTVGFHYECDTVGSRAITTK